MLLRYMISVSLGFSMKMNCYNAKYWRMTKGDYYSGKAQSGDLKVGLLG
jgi:hypothetical protein